MVGYSEFLIGFDARVPSVTIRNSWGPERVEQYLLKEVPSPLSVDVIVWPDVFHAGGIQLPDWVGPRQWLWDSLQRLQEHVETVKPVMPYWTIAVSQWLPENEIAMLKSDYRIEPSSVRTQWTLLGFDVADYYLLSGLMNAGYTDSERETYRQDWGHHLNRHHLFEDLDTALKFKVLTDERVQEHSPFYVYGIYLVEQVGLSSRTAPK